MARWGGETQGRKGAKAQGEKSPPHPALVGVIGEGDAAVADVLARASERLRRILRPSTGSGRGPGRLPVWGSPEAQALQAAVRAVVGRMYVELGQVVVERSRAALEAGLRAGNREVAAWLAQDRFMEEFEPETLEVLAELGRRAERQMGGLEAALGRRELDIGD